MKIISITPTGKDSDDRVNNVDVCIEVRCGLLWLNRKQIIKHAATHTHILWGYVDSIGTREFKLTDIINCYTEKLQKGEVIHIQPAEQGGA